MLSKPNLGGAYIKDFERQTKGKLKNNIILWKRQTVEKENDEKSGNYIM